MDYSILVPSYDPLGKKTHLLAAVLGAIDTHSMGYDYELIIRKNGKSYAESHNDALKSSRGKHIIVVTDDVVIKDNFWIEKLTTNGLAGWRMNKFHLTGEMQPDFACWSMPRELFEDVGYFDENYKHGCGYEDNDYCERAKQKKWSLLNADVNLDHLEAVTLNEYYPDRDDRTKINRKVFETKWL